VEIVNRPDGSSNLDPLLKSSKSKEQPASPSTSSKPPQLDVKKVVLSNATVRLVTQHKGGGQDLTELSKVNVTLDDLKNGQTGKLNLSASLRVDQNPPPPGTNGQLQATVAGDLAFDLTADLQPGSVKGATRLNIDNATGVFADWASAAANLECDVSPTEIKQLAVVLRKGGADLGRIRVSGPFNASKTEGRLALEVSSLDRNALGLVSAGSGMDFGSTTINFQNQIELTKGGKSITAGGQFNVSKFSVTRNQQTTPTLDLTLNYNVAVDRAAETVLVQNFEVNGMQNQQRLLLARLSSPMTLAWGKAGNAVGDAALNCVITNLNLTDWKPFLGDVAPAGTANLLLDVLVQQAGKQIGFKLNTHLTGLAMKFGSNQVSQADVALSAQGTASDLASNGPVAVTAKLLLKNLVVSDAKGNGPGKPLEASLQLDVAQRNQALDLRQCQLSLSPTPRAKNELNLTGHVDTSKSDALTGALKLQSEALDLTPYYDLFAQEPNAAATAPTKSTPAPQSGPPTSGGGEQEPPAMNLPFHDFAFDANIGHLYLREVDVSNFVAAVKLDAGRVTVKPLQLALNGAPVNANVDLNLGVPGYHYDLAFTADRIPIEPLANTFSPEYRGRAKGNLIGNAQVKGAGTTGAALQKNLAGLLSLAFTNADVQILSPRLKLFLTPVAALVRAPEILETPLNSITLRSEMGAGKINCQTLNLVSPAFVLDTAGEMPIAEVLTNSPIKKWPVNFYLKQSLAARAHMVPSGTPPDAPYAKLPPFLQVAGTLGAPKAEIDKKAVLGSALEIIADQIPGAKDKAGGLLKGIEGALTGDKSTNTNQSATNQAPRPNLLDLLKKPPK
jgi:hypothetical protein